VVAGEYAKKIAVVPGITNGDNLEILSGLKQDDQVVVLGQTFLKDGNKIAISEQ
jgi:multidrug efflux pump subunit AcrA (membrane-fusion protein)